MASRMHLRVEPDGSGLLLVNASAAVQLAPTGVLMAEGLLADADDAAIVASVARSYSAPRDRITADLTTLRELVARLATSPGGAWPIEDLRRGTEDRQVTVPLEAWMEVGPVDTLVSTLDALFARGVPHVTLLPGADDEALVRGVERAEDLGMIAGVRVVGSRLTRATLERMVDAGLDCLQVPVVSEDPAIHDALLGAGDHAAAHALLTAARELAVCAVAEVPVLESTVDQLREHARSLAAAGCGVLALWPIVGTEADALNDAALPQVQEEIEELAESGIVHVLHTPPHQGGGALADTLTRGPHAGSRVAVRIDGAGREVAP